MSTHGEPAFDELADDEDELDGCDLDFTADPVPDADLASLVRSPEAPALG
jgi:hypothetical protein